MVGFGQQSIFLLLPGFSSCGYSSSFPAKVSTQVKSQTRHWPDFHGAMEQPSGRLPSDLYRPMGSSVDIIIIHVYYIISIIHVYYIISIIHVYYIISIIHVYISIT